MTVYFTYDDEMYFTGTVSADVIPENTTTLEPENKAGYWYKFNGEVWNAQKIPETVNDIIGLSVPALPTDTTTKDTATKHESILRSIIMRILSSTDDAKASVTDGTLTVVEVTDADKLADAKTAKLEELNTIAHKFDDALVCEEMVITSSLGFKANADLRSQNNIAGLINAGVEPVQYCDAENQFHSLTLENLKILQQECIALGLSLYQQKWVYRNQINSATTVDEVNAIEIKFVMSDYSKAE
jgi:hypothetical protein